MKIVFKQLALLLVMGPLHCSSFKQWKTSWANDSWGTAMQAGHSLHIYCRRSRCLKRLENGILLFKLKAVDSNLGSPSTRYTTESERVSLSPPPDLSSQSSNKRTYHWLWRLNELTSYYTESTLTHKSFMVKHIHQACIIVYCNCTINVSINFYSDHN